ncbi:MULTISPECIES: recombination protein RecT [Providencia]|uniref:Recombination protein RecT n=1 Tax=Providencia stuartii TaxID=588 RepID=A0AAJ1JII8_PROST|nr:MULTISPECIES: recombination protein RecT [Providencia]MDE5305481.1 recombination protein RecT [Providencia stuartii]MDE5307271.1 recombination protein RecT [Providencia stuartii]MDE8752789.1 recombination protein RecT [Providencia thailandensis]MDE8772037.1 recombination protein RecT [Providencia thailandensis]MDE8776345.1 recombination protein RecT [Providencia thailandensis]
MSNPPLAQADLQKTQGTEVKEKTKDQMLVELINKPSMKAQLAAALPRHMTPDRMIRIVTTEIRKTPALATCDMQSFVGAVVQCSQLGLEPGNALGHAYLLPFGNGKSKSGQSNVQLIIGYRGMIDLARRSGQIVSISARTVRQGDNFHFEYGLNENLTHVPGENEDSPITHVYAVARLKDGGVQFEVMTYNQIEKVRASSKAGQNGPWVSHWEEMAKKTVIRRLFKYLPVSIEMQKAVILDEKAEANIDQENATIFEGEYEEVGTDGK